MRMKQYRPFLAERWFIIPVKCAAIIMIREHAEVMKTVPAVIRAADHAGKTGMGAAAA